MQYEAASLARKMARGAISSGSPVRQRQLVDKPLQIPRILPQGLAELRLHQARADGVDTDFHGAHSAARTFVRLISAALLTL